MWIKLDKTLMNSTPIRKCRQNLYKGDSQNELRALICIQMLIESANGASWFDPADLSAWLSIRGKSCEKVWEICKEAQVLRPCGDCRFSALQWLKENKYIGDNRRNTSVSASRTGF